MSTSAINLTSSVLDVASIVDGLIYIESSPVRNMQSQVTVLQSKLSAYQSLNTMLSALSGKVNTMLFRDAEAPFVQPGSFADRLQDSLFAGCMVASSNPDVISATASNSIFVGSYSITVTGLAQAQSVASSGFADTASAALATGTLTITTGDHDPVTITIDSTNNTLSGLRDAINNANAGVAASIINDGSPDTPYRLLIKANETGTANSFTLAEGLSGGQALELVQTQAASDAQFTLNGVSIVKSSNTVSDVISGVTFTLKELASAPVTLSIDKDVDSIVGAVNEFVTAYNAVNSFINSQFRYDPSTEKAGVLAADSTLRRIQSTLQNQITQRVTNPFTSFSAAGQAGLEFNRDGSLTLDESKFREALAGDFTGVAALFLGDGASSEGYGGILMNLFRVLDGITDPLSGPIHNATDGLNRNIDSLQDRISSYQERLEKRREMLTLEYSRADEALRLMTVLQAQLSSQISALTG